VGRLGSGIWASASFQMFALAAGVKCPRWGWKFSGREMSRGECITLAGRGRRKRSLYSINEKKAYFDRVGQLYKLHAASAVYEVDHFDQFLRRLRSSRSAIEDRLEFAADSEQKTIQTFVITASILTGGGRF